MSNIEKIVEIPLGKDLQYTGMTVHKLAPNQVLEETLAKDVEACVVILSGDAQAKINDVDYEINGNRTTVFDDRAPYALYITAGDAYVVQAQTACEVAICRAPGKATYPSRFITPSDCSVEHRGSGQIQRVAKNILPETEPADSLLVVEVITTGGNWSSFPSHRHDEDNLPTQSYLEEIYYHKLNPDTGGFALQRVYNDDHSLDEAYVVKNNSTVLVKEGYHPVAVPPGYDLYYLNNMAGPKRTWKFYNDPYFEKLLKP
ncbi:MAG TPA: 5-deoxy-glucuronate isomerase [Erysipelothrix sp.]|nr:5-deoxy-glucuronate isomerase [Erysipelothrix sp.]